MNDRAHARHRRLRRRLPARLIERAKPEDLRLFIIECPLETWGDKNVRDLFGDLVGLKLLGFGAFHKAGVLPVDTTDFFGRHYLSCVDTGDGLHLLASFRAVDLARCRSFNLPFAAESLAHAAGSPLHAKTVSEFVQQGDPVAYIGSWTMHPEVRRNPPLRAALRDHFSLGAILFLREAGVPRIIVGATLRFKVDRLLATVGYQALSSNGQVLPPIAVKHLHEEPVQLMYLDAGSPDVLGRAESLRGLWDSRVVY